MKVKLKQTIIILSTTLVGTVGLATGLSFLPTKDKVVPRGSQSFDNNTKKHNDPNIPGLPSESSPKNNSEPALVLNNRPKSLNLISENESVKYLALGDSISAGFDAKLDNDYPGKLVNSSVEGLSFPAYLASFLQKLSNDKLESFDNKAVSGSTFKEWNLLLNYESNSSINNDDLKELNTKFGPDLLSVKNEIIEKIKNSNLITITLGANDFIKELLSKAIVNIPILDLVKQIRSKNLDYNMLVSHFNVIFKNVFEKLEIRQKELISTLKKINNKANVNFVGYPLPLTFLMDLVDKAINKNDQGNLLSIGHILLDLLNKKNKYTAISNKTYFINPYHSSLWKNDLKLLTPNIFDIHPSTFGYKKMAMDVFIKLINPSRDLNKYHQNKILWDNKYLQSDQDSFEHQIDVEKPFEKIKEIFNDNLEAFLKQEDDLFLVHKSKISQQNYINRVLSYNGLGNLIFIDLMNSMFKSNVYAKIDPNKRLQNFMYKNDHEHQKALRDWFFNEKFVAKFLLDVQKQLFEYDWDQDNEPGAKNYQLTYFLQSLKTQILKEERIIEFITSFCSNPVISGHKDELKSIFEEIFSNIVAQEVDYDDIHSLVKTFYNDNIARFISQSDLTNLIKIILNTKSLKEAFGNLVVELIDSAHEYAKCKNFIELFNVFINNNKNKENIRKFFESIAKDLFNDNEFKQIISRLGSNVIKQYPELVKDIDENNLKKLIYELLSLSGEVNNELQLSTKFIDSLLSELSKGNIKNFKFSDVISNTLDEFNKIFDKQNWQESTYKLIKIVSSSNLSQYRATISQLVKNALRFVNSKNSIAEKIVNLFYDKNQPKISEYISKEDLTKLFEKTFKTDEFGNLIFQLINDLLKTDQSQLANTNNLFDALKVIFKNFVNTSAYDYISPLIKKIFDFPETKSLFKKLIAKLPTDEAKNLNDQDVVDIVAYILDNKEFKDILENFLTKAIFDNSMSIDKLGDFNNIIKLWFNEQNNIDYLVEKASKFVLNVSQQDSIKRILTSLLYESLSKRKNLIKGISQQEMQDFISDLLTIVPTLDKEFNITKDILGKLLPELKTKGTQIDFKAFMLEFAKSINEKFFNKTNWEANSVKLIKILVTKNTVSKHHTFLRKFIKNILVYVSDDIALGSKLFKQLPQKVHSVIDKHISEADFNNMFIDLFQHTEGLQRIVDNILDSLFNDIDSYQSANSLIDILKIYVMPQERADKLAQNLEDVLKDFLKNKSLHKLLRGLFDEHVKPYDIDSTSAENKALVDDLLANLHNFFVELKMVPNLANTMVDSFKKYNNFDQIIKDISPILVNGLKLKEYSFVATILKNNIVNKHKDVIRENLNKVIIGITSKDELVNKFIDDFHLVSPFTQYGLSEQKARDFLKEVIKSQNLKNILDAFIKEVLDKNLEYAQLNSWTEAISKFMNSSNATIIKDSIKKYISELFTKNQEVAYSIGTILATNLRNSGWSVDKNEDVKIQKFIHSFGKALLKTSILDDIVESIFERLKKINEYGFEKLSENLKNATKEGAIKFISSGGKVYLSNIFNQIPLINQLLSEVPQAEIVDFINLMFKSTPKNDQAGLYKVMFNSAQGTEKFEVGIGWSGLWDIIRGKLSNLISAIASPLVKEFLKQASEKTYSDHNDIRKNNSGFQALWRVYSFMASILYSNTPRGLFWNATNLTSEGYLMGGFMNAFSSNLNDYKTALMAKYTDGNSKVLIGYDNNMNPLNYYLSGMTTTWNWTGTLYSRSNGLSSSNYGSDHVLVYIYYKDKRDDKFTHKTFKEGLIDYMHQGYMPYK
ncbi:SGNH/GDSL hydrolase family protein [Mycoplasmopsis caviae]|uniref:SGNH/GDSL hydrolase family protein n=1 Tax=Mycoplasmopsis caviae TaxID=55603 RepID=A0A3P8MES0_9BACT|nr:SGNH/GDSL hydrolase family protein [Mycoplasmopsis caviae]UUD34970.1 SGNH/GDSL hydrolase family protein [Mycoplasmopsis caviae]VDR42206.1 Uncharacterised protein [Mycoplasmopsis caviae]